MSTPYVIEAPKASAPDDAPDAGDAAGEPSPSRVHRPRIGQEIMSKLDQILDHVKGGDTEHAAEGTPEVTFEPEPEQLPTTAGDEEPDEEGGDEDEPETANTPEVHQRQPFKFPGRRYARNLER